MGGNVHIFTAVGFTSKNDNFQGTTISPKNCNKIRALAEAYCLHI